MTIGLALSPIALGLTSGKSDADANFPSPTFSAFLSAPAYNPLITFTRASTRTYFGPGGAAAGMLSAANDVWPLEYSASGVLLGRSLWEARTNLLLNSLLDGTSLTTQSATVTAAAHTLSFYGTGTVTLSGVSSAGPLVGTGANERVSLTFTPTAGSLTLTVSGQVKWANLTLGAFATPFIPTAGASATRAADVASIEGTNFSDWYNQTEGTFVVGFRLANAGVSNIGVSDGTYNERLDLRVGGTTSSSLIVVDGGVTQVSQGVSGLAANTSYRFAAAYAANDFAVSRNGSAASKDTSGTLPTPNQVRFGDSSGAAGLTSYYLDHFAYYPKRLSDSILRGLSS